MSTCMTCGSAMTEVVADFAVPENRGGGAVPGIKMWRCKCGESMLSSYECMRIDIHVLEAERDAARASLATAQARVNELSEAFTDALELTETNYYDRDERWYLRHDALRALFKALAQPPTAAKETSE